MAKNTNKAAKTSNATTISAGVAAVSPATNATTVVAVVPTKADKARAVFAECYADKAAIPQRKDIIARMVAEAGLTKAGAATYLQNMKKKAGLVASKTTTAAA